MAMSQEPERWAEREGSEKSGARCRACGGFTEGTYFDRWEDILGARLSAADDDFSGGRVRQGRRKLEELQVR